MATRHQNRQLSVQTNVPKFCICRSESRWLTPRRDQAPMRRLIDRNYVGR
ncbi:hypothetical protein N184_27255 [Sinorhizobium sp. GL28]|nr:hypothetical protein N184_27255 [Sinorhizobium sp. GL28]